MKFWYFPTIALIALTTRYLLLSVTSYEYFWNWKRAKYAHLRIQKTFPRAAQLFNEVKWSTSTFIVFALMASALYWPVLHGYSKLYFDVAQRGWSYFFASIVALIFLHDTYFYFAHRLMHTKLLFKHVHRVHHLSTTPSPLAAFSFHPLEAVIEFLFAAVVVFIFPIHIAALAIFLFFSHFMNALGHLGYELYPKGFPQKKVLNLLNTSTHHNMHHHYFNGNYGLYFGFWDKIFGTEFRNYTDEFEKTKGHSFQSGLSVKQETSLVSGRLS